MVDLSIPEGFKAFYCYLTIPGEYGHLYSDIIVAKDKSEVRSIIERDNNCKIAEKVSSKNISKVDYRVFIVELNDYWGKHWLSIRKCKACDIEYNLIQNKQMKGSANAEFCSYYCSQKNKPLRVPLETPGIHNPVIYKITNKNSNNSYIGQTTQAFTFRWYQHFYSPGDSKFHKEIRESSFSDWTFEVLEVLPKECPQNHINERECYYISKYNGEGFGLNTVLPKAG